MAAPTKSQWENILSALVSDMEQGVYEASVSIAGQSFSYRTLEELQSFITFVEGKIAQFSGGPFALAQFVDI